MYPCQEVEIKEWVKLSKKVVLPIPFFYRYRPSEYDRNLCDATYCFGRIDAHGHTSFKVTEYGKHYEYEPKCYGGYKLPDEVIVDALKDPMTLEQFERDLRNFKILIDYLQ
jgi:hypothetical protein